MKAPLFLNQLIDLTSIRDIELFDLSLLKSLTELLNISEISMFIVSNEHKPCREIHYKKNNDDLEQHESSSIRRTEIELPGIINQAINWFKATGKPYFSELEKQCQVVYPVLHKNSESTGYIRILLDHQITEIESLVISNLLKISHNFYALLEENQTDKLTGLLNRKTFDDSIMKMTSAISKADEKEQYAGEEKRSSHSDYTTWLAMLDVDFFKKINDEHGHVFGDEILLLISQIMKDNFRTNDLLFRYGGEEFVIVITTENIKDAQNVFERLRVAIERYDFPQVDNVTVSIGVTELNLSNMMIVSNILDEADKALYYAKDQGRNQIHFYQDLIQRGFFKPEVQESNIELF